MTESLAGLSARIASVGQLHTIVTGMRSIAAGRAHQSQARIAGVEAYTAVVGRAIGDALALLGDRDRAMAPPAQGRAAIVVLAAELGFCGPFSEHAFDLLPASLDDTLLIVVGSRGHILAEERGIRAGLSVPMATQAGGVEPLAERLLERLYEDIGTGSVHTVDVLFSRTGSGGGIAAERTTLLPLPEAAFTAGRRARQPPLITLSPRVLVEHLAAEYLYARLCYAILHSLAAENEARMIATTAARRHIETTIADLEGRWRTARQEAITAEIVELSAGTDAISGRDR